MPASSSELKCLTTAGSQQKSAAVQWRTSSSSRGGWPPSMASSRIAASSRSGMAMLCTDGKPGAVSSLPRAKSTIGVEIRNGGDPCVSTSRSVSYLETDVSDLCVRPDRGARSRWQQALVGPPADRPGIKRGVGAGRKGAGPPLVSPGAHGRRGCPGTVALADRPFIAARGHFLSEINGGSTPSPPSCISNIPVESAPFRLHFSTRPCCKRCWKRPIFR
jgi:hypothetical protein